MKIKRNEVFFEKLELNTVPSKRRKNKRIRICDSCSRMFNNENIVIAMKKCPDSRN